MGWGWDRALTLWLPGSVILSSQPHRQCTQGEGNNKCVCGGICMTMGGTSEGQWSGGEKQHAHAHKPLLLPERASIAAAPVDS